MPFFISIPSFYKSHGTYYIRVSGKNNIYFFKKNKKHVRISTDPKTVPIDKVIINGEIARNSRVVIWADLGKACVLMEQETDGEKVLGLAVPTLNDEGKMTRPPNVSCIRIGSLRQYA